MQKLIIFPFNGNGLESYYCLNGSYDFIGFADDETKKHGKHNQFQIFSREIIFNFPEAKVLAVPGSPASFLIRKKIIDKLNIPIDRFATIIHPGAIVSGDAHIGYNVLIMAGVVITSNAVIKNHVCILPNSVIHHDVVIGEHTIIGSNVNIASETKIGDNCYIGSGSNVINKIEIGAQSLIGLGANVIKSFAPMSKIVGNPARSI